MAKSFDLQALSREDLLAFTSVREGEKKLGEKIHLLADVNLLKEELKKFKGRFCLLGIPEDIGPRANFGKAGTKDMFADFLTAFCNMQHNAFLDARNIMLLGNIKMDDLIKKASKLSPNNEDELSKLRELVIEIDNRVFPVIEAVVAAGKIPIIIGGGHNNAYPIIKGAYLGLNKRAIGCINIDPHADLRQLEGRHSGNGFSYAIAHGHLDKYFLLGLHQNYNNDYIWGKLNSDKELFRYMTAEEMLDKDLSLSDVSSKALKFLKNMRVGLEIDIDGIRFAESSAKTPVGFSESKVRKLIRHLTRDKNIVYLNLSEGIPSTNQTAKLLAYLVSDFIRAVDI